MRRFLGSVAGCVVLWGAAFLACAFDGVEGDAGFLLGMLYGGSAGIGSGLLIFGRL